MARTSSNPFRYCFVSSYSAHITFRVVSAYGIGVNDYSTLFLHLHGYVGKVSIVNLSRRCFKVFVEAQKHKVKCLQNLTANQ